MTSPQTYYHDFSLLGLNLPQTPGIFGPNQAAKSPILLGYLHYAIGKLKTRGVVPLTFTELFCADAYYAFCARHFGVDRAYGFDNNRDGFLDQARQIQTILGEQGVELHQTEVLQVPVDFRSSIVANIGGLYHVEDPLRVLQFSYEMAKDYLIVQSVVSLANESPDYFETPAPGWDCGCRFSFGFLERAVAALGGEILDSDQNILSGNGRPEDMGSAYFLIKKM